MLLKVPEGWTAPEFSELVQKYHSRWGMTDVELTGKRCFYLLTSTYYAQAVQIPFVLRGMPGLLMAVSTPDSNRKANENYQTVRAGRIITEPA